MAPPTPPSPIQQLAQTLAANGTPLRTRARGNGSAARRSTTALRGLSSDLMLRRRFAVREGLTFNGRRDLYAQLGYERQLTFDHCAERYRRGGIAKRIVEAYPRATWSGGAQLVENPDPDVTTPFETAVAALFNRLDVWARLQRADILAGLGKYSLLLIGTTNGNLEAPLGDRLRSDDVLYLTPIAENRVTKIEIVGEATTIATSPSNPAVDAPAAARSNERFGLPLYYHVSFNNLVRPTSRVHYTRVIHIAEGLLEDDVLGTPRLEAVWNYLDDLFKIVGGGAEAAWMRADPGMHVNVRGEDELETDEEQLIAEQVEDYQHGLSRALFTREADIRLLHTNVQMFGPNVDSILQLISATTGIPKRILAGTERGDLASTQDRNNWRDRVSERWREFATPVVHQLVNRLVDHGALPTPAQYAVMWPEEEEMTPQEKADVVYKFALANEAQAKSGAGILITGTEVRDAVLGLPPLDESSLPPPPPTAPPPATGTDVEVEDEPSTTADDREERPSA